MTYRPTETSFGPPLTLRIPSILYAVLAGAAVLFCLLVGAVMGHGAGIVWQVAEWTALAQLGGIALWCGLAWRTT